MSETCQTKRRRVHRVLLIIPRRGTSREAFLATRWKAAGPASDDELQFCRIIVVDFETDADLFDLWLFPAHPILLQTSMLE
jgi:hypothetical protein